MKCGSVKCKPCKEGRGCCRGKAALEEAGRNGAGLVLQDEGWGWQEQRSQNAAQRGGHRSHANSKLMSPASLSPQGFMGLN